MTNQEKLEAVRNKIIEACDYVKIGGGFPPFKHTCSTPQPEEKEEKSIGKTIFDMVYQWGRVGVVVDYTAPAYQDEIKKLITQPENKEKENCGYCDMDWYKPTLEEKKCHHSGFHEEVVICGTCKDILPEMKSSRCTPQPESEGVGIKFWRKDFIEEFEFYSPELKEWIFKFVSPINAEAFIEKLLQAQDKQIRSEERERHKNCNCNS